nr:MAG TPA: hypothetical protein [Caudoviricetes sp.]
MVTLLSLVSYVIVYITLYSSLGYRQLFNIKRL